MCHFHTFPWQGKDVLCMLACRASVEKTHTGRKRLQVLDINKAPRVGSFLLENNALALIKERPVYVSASPAVSLFLWWSDLCSLARKCQRQEVGEGRKKDIVCTDSWYQSINKPFPSCDSLSLHSNCYSKRLYLLQQRQIRAVQERAPTCAKPADGSVPFKVQIRVDVLFGRSGYRPRCHSNGFWKQWFKAAGGRTLQPMAERRPTANGPVRPHSTNGGIVMQIRLGYEHGDIKLTLLMISERKMFRWEAQTA